MSIFHRSILFFKQRTGFFIPSLLKKALIEYDVAQPTQVQLYAVFNALIEHRQGGSYRYYTSSTLAHFYHHVQRQIDSIYRFHHDDLAHSYTTPTTAEANDHVLSSWCILMDAGLYSPMNRDRIQQKARTSLMIKGLYILLQTKLLNQSTLNFLLDHDNPNNFMFAILILKQQQLLNHDNFVSLKQHASACNDVLRLLWSINSALIPTNLSSIFTLSPQSMDVLKTALTEFHHYTVTTLLNEELFNIFLIIADDCYYLSKKSLFKTLLSHECLPLTEKSMSTLLLDKHQENTMSSVIYTVSFLKQYYPALSMHTFVDSILTHKSAIEMAPLVTNFHHIRRWSEALLIACAKHVSLRQLMMLILQTAPQCINNQTITAMQLFDAARSLLTIWHPQFTTTRLLTFCHHPQRWLISQSLQRLNMHHTPQYITLLDYFLTCKNASVVQNLETLISLFSKTELFEIQVFDALTHRFAASSHANIISTKLVTLFTLLAKNAPHLLLKPHFDDIMQHQELDVLTDILQLLDEHHATTLDSPLFFILCAYSEPRLIKLSLLHIKNLPDCTTHLNEIKLLLHSLKLTYHGLSTKSIPLSLQTSSLSSNRYIYWQPAPISEENASSQPIHEQHHTHPRVSFTEI